MSKSNATETDLVAYIFTSVAIPWATIPNIYISLHTADPGETGNQSTSEATYTSYARTTVARTSAGWSIGTGTATNAALISCPQCTGGSNTITYVGLGTTATGTGQLLYSGALNSSLTVSNLITPQFAALALTVTED